MSDDVNPYNAGPPTPPIAPAADRAYPLEVRFELQEEDEVAALLASRPRVERPRTFIISMAIGLLTCAGVLIARFEDAISSDLFIRGVTVGILLFLLGAGLSFFGTGRLSSRLIGDAVKTTYADPRHRKLAGWIRLSLSPAGIQQSAEHCESLWRWTAVDRIEVVKELLLFHLGAAHVLLIPKRAFQDEAHLQSFLDAARRFHRLALGGDSQTPFDRTP